MTTDKGNAVNGTPKSGGILKRQAAKVPQESVPVVQPQHTVLTHEQEEKLTKIVAKILQPGKGVLAADDTNEQIGVRFNSYGMENTAENRRRYRQLLFTTPKISESISAVILYDDTYKQRTEKGERLVDLLHRQDIVPGIQVDRGLVPLTGSVHNEVTTQGMDDLAARAREYKKNGCEFAKFLVMYRVSDATPSHLALTENANLSARYASICQKEGLVPFIEPNVACDGAHSLEKCQEVTEAVLSYTYKAMVEHNVFLEGTVLKTNMVTPGLSATQSVTPEDVAQATVTCMRRTVPPAVPGIAFLSGGLPDLAATQYLQAINELQHGDMPSECFKPWRLTFCYGRALQSQVMQIWSGHGENIQAAQSAFLIRATANARASDGKYTSEKDVTDSLHSNIVEKIGIYY